MSSFSCLRFQVVSNQTISPGVAGQKVNLIDLFFQAAFLIEGELYIIEQNLRLQDIKPILCGLPLLLSFLLHHFSAILFLHLFLQPQSKRKSFLSKANPGSHILGLIPFCLVYPSPLLPSLNFPPLFLYLILSLGLYNIPKLPLTLSL